MNTIKTTKKGITLHRIMCIACCILMAVLAATALYSVIALGRTEHLFTSVVYTAMAWLVGTRAKVK